MQAHTDRHPPRAGAPEWRVLPIAAHLVGHRLDTQTVRIWAGCARFISACVPPHYCNSPVCLGM